MRRLLADTFALVTFFTVVGAVNERLIAGLDWSEIAHARLAACPVMLLTGRPYGLWRDLVVMRAMSARPGAWTETLADAAALVSFQFPVYALVLVFSGAERAEIVLALAGSLPILLFSGRPYGLWLGFVRRWAG